MHSGAELLSPDIRHPAVKYPDQSWLVEEQIQSAIFSGVRKDHGPLSVTLKPHHPLWGRPSDAIQVRLDQSVMI